MTIEASKLTIDLQEEARWRRTLRVTVPAELVREEREKIASTLAKKLKLPGFRSGRIPASVVEKRYGPALNREMLDRIIGEAYREALRVEALRPISEGEVAEVQYEPERDLVFSVSFDVQPAVDIGRVGGFRVERPKIQIEDADVERVVQRLREQDSVWRGAEGTPVNGDLVAVTVQPLDEGAESEAQQYELVLGSGDAIPDVESAIQTLEPGGSGEFDVSFPEDFPSEARRGTRQRLSVTLRERKVRELPPLDDAFASSVGEFENLAELRTRIREDLRKESESHQRAVVRGRLLDALVDANAFEVPRTMVDRYVESMLGDTRNADPERLARVKEQLRPDAERAVRRIVVLERVADTQGLSASEAEIDERVEAIAEKNQITPSEAYARLQKSGRLEALEREITEEKVFAFLEGKSEITDEG